MIDVTPDDRLLLLQAYKTLRRTIYWAKDLAKSEWIHDHCRYPFRNYIKRGTEQDIKAAWCIRRIIRTATACNGQGGSCGASWDDATINFGVCASSRPA